MPKGCPPALPSTRATCPSTTAPCNDTAPWRMGCIHIAAPCSTGEGGTGAAGMLGTRLLNAAGAALEPPQESAPSAPPLVVMLARLTVQASSPESAFGAGSSWYETSCRSRLSIPPEKTAEFRFVSVIVTDHSVGVGRTMPSGTAMRMPLVYVVPPNVSGWSRGWISPRIHAESRMVPVVVRNVPVTLSKASMAAMGVSLDGGRTMKSTVPLREYRT